MFDEGVCDRSVKLLGVDDGGAHILRLRHGWIRLLEKACEDAGHEDISANDEWKNGEARTATGSVEAESRACEYRSNNNSMAECIPPHSCRRLGKR